MKTSHVSSNCSSCCSFNHLIYIDFLHCTAFIIFCTNFSSQLLSLHIELDFDYMACQSFFFFFFTSSSVINRCPTNPNLLISSWFCLKSSFVPTNNLGTFSQKWVTSGSHLSWTFVNDVRKLIAKQIKTTSVSGYDKGLNRS